MQNLLNDVQTVQICKKHECEMTINPSYNNFNQNQRFQCQQCSKESNTFNEMGYHQENNAKSELNYQSNSLQQQQDHIKDQEKTLNQVNELTPLNNITLQSIKNFNIKDLRLTPFKMIINCLAFNYNDQILACGANQYVIIFNISNGELNVDKILEKHNNMINCILFSKKINWFITASDDHSLISWKQNEDNWKDKQFEEHKSYIFCLLLSQNEDILFSGSADKTIKIWKVDQNENQLEYLYNLKNGHTSWVMSMSINYNQDVLVSTTLDCEIIMWKKQDNGEWKNQYSKKCSSNGYRVCFIDNDQFICQVKGQELLHVFKIYGDKFQLKDDLSFQLSESTGDNQFHSSIFVYEKQMLIHKYHQCVYFFKKQQDGKLEFQDQIHCLGNFNISNKLNYFVHWDEGQNQIKLFQMIMK